jgi:hypothetical protein
MPVKTVAGAGVGCAKSGNAVMSATGRLALSVLRIMPESL